jgi:maltoporin
MGCKNMKKINLLAAAVLAAGALSSSAFADYTPNAYFGGYFRSGVMHSDSGRSPKYNVNKVGRLGNENDTYGEIVLGADVAKVDNTVWTVNTRVALSSDHNKDWQTQTGSNGEKTDVAFREFWLNVKGICSWDADASLWAGKRFYRREDIHITDMYYHDISGMGAGIENLTLGSGKFSAAWIRQDDNTKYEWKYNTIISDFTLPTYVSLDKVDLEYDLPAWDGANFEFRTTFFIPTRDSNDSWKDLTKAKNEFKGAQLYTVELSQGYSLGWNKTVVQYFHGSNADWSAFGTGNWLNYDGSSNKAHRWSLINMGETHFTDTVGMFHVLYGTTSDGYDNNLNSTNYTAKKSDKAVSFVVRPYVKLTKMSRIYAELGWFAQSTKKFNKGNEGTYNETDHGSKYTIAYALTPDAGNFWSRPELRFFVSYLKGKDGSDISSYGDTQKWKRTIGDVVVQSGGSKDSNYIFGVQAEAWW